MSWTINTERKCSCHGRNPTCQLCDGHGTYEVQGCAMCKGTGKLAGKVRCLNCRGTGEALTVVSNGEDDDEFVDFTA